MSLLISDTLSTLCHILDFETGWFSGWYFNFWLILKKCYIIIHLYHIYATMQGHDIKRKDVLKTFFFKSTQFASVQRTRSEVVKLGFICTISIPCHVTVSCIFIWHFIFVSMPILTVQNYFQIVCHICIVMWAFID